MNINTIFLVHLLLKNRFRLSRHWGILPYCNAEECLLQSGPLINKSLFFNSLQSIEPQRLQKSSVINYP